ncbi:MAG TPA: hypothetical protein DG753_14260 [Clostridium sp.]|nr:hypothetical protein [Clostridium sp.]
MIEIKKITDDLLKDSIDYEDYSENICTLTIEEMRAEGILKCGGCCNKGGGSKCSSCGSKGKCGGCKSKNK